MNNASEFILETVKKLIENKTVKAIEQAKIEACKEAAEIFKPLIINGVITQEDFIQVMNSQGVKIEVNPPSKSKLNTNSNDNTPDPCSRSFGVRSCC